MAGPVDTAAEGAPDTLTRLAAFRAGRKKTPAILAARLRERYLKTDRDEQLADALDAALCALALRRSDGSRFEGTGVVVTGGSGSGKSFASRRVLSRHPLFPDYGSASCIAIAVRCLGSFTLGRLGAEIANATGYPIVSNEENVIWDRLRKRIKDRIALIHIDEINSLLRNANKMERDKIVVTLKSLMNDETWPVALVISGTPRVQKILETHDPDGELCRRLTWKAFDKLEYPTHNEGVAHHLAQLCAMAEIAFDETVFREEAASRLLHAARCELGLCVDYGVHAIELAIEQGDKRLKTDHLATVYARRWNKGANENPFLAHDWAKVKIFDPDENEFEPASPGKGGRR